MLECTGIHYQYLFSKNVVAEDRDLFVCNDSLANETRNGGSVWCVRYLLVEGAGRVNELGSVVGIILRSGGGGGATYDVSDQHL